jgi:opacity protein-like surface antigen
MYRIAPVAAAFIVTLAFAAARPASSAGQSWDVAATGMFGGSAPLTIQGFRVADPTVPLDLTTDNVTSNKAAVLGGGIQLFKLRERGVEWGFAFDVRTYRYDGEAGVPNHVYGTIGGVPVDEIQISAGQDDARVTMALGAFMVRWPLGRTAERPTGRWLPYVGVGGGDQRVRILRPEPLFTSHAPTIQAMAGAEARLSRRVGVFGEYRFERVRDRAVVDTTEINIKLRTNHLAGGVLIHF